MHISQDAIAGTLESSDAMVKVSPHPDDALEVVIDSTVAAQFGHAVRQVVDETLGGLGVDAGLVVVEDKGALDCTLRARVQAAVMRGTGTTDPDWSAL